ncbi:hypothetical protein BDW74DRAFT_107753 [Aspergillus multicolor]|uniref:uncharacterized protein n=1 Tax=Aspergillus multicolor TaxID=41759 RepID=UPI003CCD0EB6
MSGRLCLFKLSSRRSQCGPVILSVDTDSFVALAVPSGLCFDRSIIPCRGSASRHCSTLASLSSRFWPAAQGLSTVEDRIVHDCVVKNPLKIMTAIMHRIRRKRKISSELDSRWGDMAISSPNEGSWSQYGASPKTSPVSAASFDHDHGPRPVEPPEPYTFNGIKAGVANDVPVNSLNMPTGYYDAKLQRQKTKSRAPKVQPVQPKPITLPKSWEEKKFGDSSADEAGDNVSSLGSPRKRGTDDANSRGSKSPPLSVTSRMRRYSGQSTATDPIFSVPGTASSQRTSFSADDPRLARHPPLPLPAQPDKKPPQGPKVRDGEPNTASQELVPSYDDLYG